MSTRRLAVGLMCIQFFVIGFTSSGRKRILYGSTGGPVKRFFILATKKHRKHKGEKVGSDLFFILCFLFLFLWLLSVVTGAMADFEFFFFQFGIGDFDCDFAVRAVAFFVCGGISDEVLRSQFALDLGKRRVQVKLFVREERAATSAFRQLTQRIPIDAIALT